MDHLNVGTGSAIILNLPLLFATTGKRNLLSFITGIPYRSLNFFHRAIGRFCFIMSVVHMSLVLEWLRKKNGSSSLMQQFSKQFIQCGLVAITCFCISITMSMLPVRCRKFELFMFTHVCAALVCLPAIYYHKSKTHQWVLATATIWSFDRLARLLGIIYIHFIAPFWCHTNSPRHFGPVNATLDHLDGAIVLSIPMALTWKPGQHIYLSFWSKKMLLKPWLLGRWHPFTLTNTPYDLELQRKYRTEICETSKKCIGCCVIQVRGGTTRWLQKNAGSNISVFIEGPYGGNLNPHAAYSTLVLVAGGAGITYLLGVLEGVALLAQQGKSGSLRRVVIYWMLRKQAHLAWVENRVNEVCAALGTFNLCISAHAYITTRLPVVVPSSRDNFQASATSSKTKASEGEYIKMIHNPISLSLQKPLNSEKYLRSTLVLSDPSKRENKSVFQVLGGRPNLDEILSKICHQSLGRIQIQVCGPKNLSDAVKLAAAKISSPLATWNGKNNTCVAVHYEIFNNT
ncbi:hypothetical protein O181_038755 [Austropuccinia psidii MF-1]|uniref:FAD-binding FR-type domain-containing protein n=1 Tax=Austropuccinia psidii MF-1 TaxID=1389203 RepID=A0A9Q3DDI0_9BASI|nr:hypothetical protein [Austropuccinia psidii MF-1]